MTSWITEEFGNRTFTHQGWTVRIWSPEYWRRWNPIEVESPRAGEEVEIHPEGIWVKGESPGGWEGPSSAAFVIPWAVITAVTEAREIVEREKE